MSSIAGDCTFPAKGVREVTFLLRIRRLVENEPVLAQAEQNQAVKIWN